MRPFGHHQRRASRHGDLIHGAAQVVWELAALGLDVVLDGGSRALADLAVAQVHATHAGLGGEGHEVGIEGVQVPFAQSVVLFGQHHDAAAFGRLIRERGQLGRVGKHLDVHAFAGDEGHGLAIAQGDGAGLVQQQHVHVPGGFHGAARGGDDVGLDHAVHAGDADGRQQAADGGGNQADQQGDQDGQAHGAALARGPGREEGEGQQRGHGQEEDDGEARQEDVQGDLVGRLLALGAFHHGDHAVEEALAGVGRDADHQPVGEHQGAAGDGGAVTAALADDGGALSGDGAFVHGRHALDHLTVAGDGFPGFHQHQIVDAQVRRVDHPVAAQAVRAGQPLGFHVPLGFAQGVGLSLAPALRHGFGEVGEQQREPEPEGDGQDEAGAPSAVARESLHPQAGGEGAADPDGEHDGIPQLVQRVQLSKGVEHRTAHDAGFEEGAGLTSGPNSRLRGLGNVLAIRGNHGQLQTQRRSSCSAMGPRARAGR